MVISIKVQFSLKTMLGISYLRHRVMKTNVITYLKRMIQHLLVQFSCEQGSITTILKIFQS